VFVTQDNGSELKATKVLGGDTVTLVVQL